jgi:pimeloyl-ACP methyl ester carboxylesterase
MPHLTLDGVKLHYEEQGTGPRAIVFVHGWCCDSTYFALQAEHFAAGNRCISVDLRGHGKSDRPDQDYTIDGFADDIAWLCGQLGVEWPLVVGHSMGGLVALSMAGRAAGMPMAIAMLDSPILPSDGIRGLMAQASDTFRGPAYKDAAQTLVATTMFIATSDPALKSRVVDAMSSAPQHVLASCWEAILGFDGETAAKSCRVPALFISAGGIGDTARFRSFCPQLMVEETKDSGHFHQLEVPDQINAMLDRFLAGITAAIM